MRRIFVLWMAVLPAWGAAAVESNVIYGMYSGLALLLDVHRPETPNGYGIVLVAGSGWTAPLAYGATPLKDTSQAGMYAKPLVAAGYTVFVVNHRTAPRFRYPAAVEDVQRAVRFVRHNAARFGIRADRIGAVGGSSGGHLVSMLGVLDGKGDPADADTVNRESAKVQCVVARAAPCDFVRIPSGAGAVNFLGMNFNPQAQGSEEYRMYREASPVYHVTGEDPPFLLMHGEADTTVSIRHSEGMEAALRAAGVTVKLLRVPGGAHGPNFPGAVNPPDYLGAMVQWMNQYLVRGL